ncbi:MAG: hypothetical protein KDD15_29095 [Lewinella sp.]|nr:hypothetical protein [Lewinella sp.]
MYPKSILFTPAMLYFEHMTQKRRVYLLRHSHDPVDQDIYSSLKYLVEQAGIDLSYRGVISRLHRAKETREDGKQIIRLRDKQGNPITIEIQDILKQE